MMDVCAAQLPTDCHAACEHKTRAFSLDCTAATMQPEVAVEHVVTVPTQTAQHAQAHPQSVAPQSLLTSQGWSFCCVLLLALSLMTKPQVTLSRVEPCVAITTPVSQCLRRFLASGSLGETRGNVRSREPHTKSRSRSAPLGSAVPCHAWRLNAQPQVHDHTPCGPGHVRRTVMSPC